MQQVVDILAKQGWPVQRVARADGYTTYVLTDPQQRDERNGTRLPRLLVAAGLHGEEPAAVVGLTWWLLRRAADWIGRIELTVLPCINPWGFERGERFGPHGKDLNREFDAPEHPFAAGVVDYLRGRRFDLFLDLHEDCDFKAMYLYEVLDVAAGARKQPTLGRRILDGAEDRVPLSHDEPVDPFTTDHGIIAVEGDRAELRNRSGHPLALHVYINGTPHAITVETPGLQAMSLRAELHVAALEEACRYMTEAAQDTATF